MSKILSTSEKKFSAEIGKPLGLDLKLTGHFNMVTVSVGCNIKHETVIEKRVYIYEDYTDVDVLNIDAIIETDAPPTYEGKLLTVEWFMTIETGHETESFDFTVYPYHHNKYHESIK